MLVFCVRYFLTSQWANAHFSIFRISTNHWISFFQLLIPLSLSLSSCSCLTHTHTFLLSFTQSRYICFLLTQEMTWNNAGGPLAASHSLWTHTLDTFPVRKRPVQLPRIVLARPFTINTMHCLRREWGRTRSRCG